MKNTNKNLPHQLVIEILSRLPIKHLCPLRFVSKTWYQLLTQDPQFAKLQFDRFQNSSPNPSIIALRRDNWNVMVASEFESCDKALPLKYPFSDNTYRVNGICNGLLCISCCDHKKVYIWNPLINDHITVSCPRVPFRPLPSKSTSTKMLFGFDQDSNVYKLVSFFIETPLYGTSWMQISVGTIGVGSVWRTVEPKYPRDIISTSTHFPLVNGVLHWYTSGLDTASNDLIFTFDLKREVIGELLPPCGVKLDDIVELGGLLCVVDRSHESDVHIWVMKEYGLVSSWTKQYIIGKPRGWFCFMCTLGFTHDGEIIFGQDGGHLILYNPETNTVRDLKGFRVRVLHPYAYIGSIISPTVISKTGQTCLKRKEEVVQKERHF